MPQEIVIVDYGMGNLNSVAKSLKKLNISPRITSDPELIKTADKILLPGVGHFEKAVKNIHALGLWDVLNEKVMIKNTPVLGICLGMQLMAKKSEEGNVAGFEWIDAEVAKFKITDSLKYKIPHMGWNQVIQKKESVLTRGLAPGSEFYFVHSYHFSCNDPADVLHITNYEYDFVSAVEKKNIFGVQYHPEKSHNAGMILLENFVNL